MKHESIRQAALAEYIRGDRLRDIALRHDVSIGTVSLWARKAGEVRRSRGCRVKAVPNEAEMEIVAACRSAKNGRPTYREIGAPFGYSRAAVHRIYRKWKKWRPKVPFKAGDRLRWRYRDEETGERRYRDLQVLVPGVFDGLCRDLQTGKDNIYKWWVNPDTFAARMDEPLSRRRRPCRSSG